MEQKPRVGLILMRAHWPDCTGARAVLDGVQVDTQAILDRLNQHFEILDHWVVDSQESMFACQRALRVSDVDLVLLAFQTMAEDSYLAALLEAVDERPLLLWCYAAYRRLPGRLTGREILRGSGPVGTLGALGTLRNQEVPFLFTFGAAEDPRLIRDLVVAGRAALIRKALRSARFGMIPSRTDHMQSTFVDERRLAEDFGPHVAYIPVDDYRQAAAAVTQDRVEQAVARLVRRHPVVQVSRDGLERAARAALGLADLARAQGLNLAAVSDDDAGLRRAFNMIPALYPEDDGLSAELLFQPECDLGAATANYILSCLTGSPTMFLELWFWDEARNVFIGGHAGMQNPALGEGGQVSIVPAELFGQEEMQGAQFHFAARTGRVTLFNLRSTPEGWQAIAASGICLEAMPAVDDYPHAIIRMDATIAHFLNRLADIGATQHWIMAYGSVLDEIEAFCEMQKIPLEILSY